MKKGFDRLRGVATASIMGLGLLGAGSGRAATTSLPKASIKAGSISWQNIANDASLLSASTGLSTMVLPTVNANNFSITASASSNGLGINIARNTSAQAVDALRGALYLIGYQGGSKRVFKDADDIVDLTGDTMEANNPNFLSGVDTTVQYHFFQNRPLIRALYSFENTSGIDETFDVYIGGNLGTVTPAVQASSDGNTTADASDLWIVANSSTTASFPAVTISRYGKSTAAAAVPQNGVTLSAASTSLGTFVNYYPITVPANTTRRVLVFIELSKTVTDAQACAKDFETLDIADTEGLLTGFFDANVLKVEIINYSSTATTTIASSCTHSTTGGGGTPSTPTPSTPVDGDKSTGTINPASTAALLALLSLVRIRKNKKS